MKSEPENYVQAIQLEAPKQFRPVSIDEPSPPGPGEALVQTHRVGICGTDVSAYLGKMPFFGYPRIPGHELGVEVLETGAGLTNVTPGDRCSVEPYLNCGECLACRKGATNCCASLNVIGVMSDGGLCERFTIRADKLHTSNSLSYEQLALVETLAIGRHAVQRSACGAGENVLVIGSGPIGLSAIEFVKISGANTIVMDLLENRLDFCKNKMGIEKTIHFTNDLDIEQTLRDLTDGNLPDVVIDATGNNKSMSSAFQYIAPTGRLVFVGLTSDNVTFPHPIFHKPEGTMLCSRNALPQDFRDIIELIEQKKLDTDPWITHRTSFEGVPENFDEYTRLETGVVKAMIEVTA